MSSAAATSKKALKGEKVQKSSNPHSAELSAFNSQKNVKSEQNKQNSDKKASNGKIDYMGEI